MDKSIELYSKATAAIAAAARRDRGQGTVEYVGIIFIVVAIVSAVIAAVTPFGQTIMSAIGGAITTAISKITG